MYNPKDIQFVGKHDYDKSGALDMVNHFKYQFKRFSIGIFQWELKSNGKSMKKGKILVRIKADIADQNKAFKLADLIVSQLDAGEWDGRKTVSIKGGKNG